MENFSRINYIKLKNVARKRNIFAKQVIENAGT